MTERPTISFKVNIADQNFRVRIYPEEKSFYERVAQLVEASFEETSKQAMTGGPQAWAMTAFQIASEMLDGKDDLEAGPEHTERVQKIIKRIEDATMDAD